MQLLQIQHSQWKYGIQYTHKKSIQSTITHPLQAVLWGDPPPHPRQRFEPGTLTTIDHYTFIHNHYESVYHC